MRVTTNVIDLAELRADDEFPAYAAVYFPAHANPWLLSPNAMRWNENVFLSRLGDCRNFWLEQKKKLRSRLGDLFSQVLGQHCGDDFIAVFGNHPWQCLLYLDYQHAHDGRGTFLLQSRLDRNIYSGIGWDHWFGLQPDLIEHWTRVGPRGFSADSMTARQAQLRRFIDRIGVAAPAGMQQAAANSIARRFGSWLGRVWRWTFCADTDLHGFPWIDYVPQNLPRVGRELDYPVNDWGNIAVLLREDLARLSETCSRDDCAHINRMSWRITLFNYREIRVELSFRHPYSLHRDLPDFDTALYQAKYVYDDLMEKLKARETDLDLPEHMPFIAWRVEIDERIELTPALWDLFADDSGQVDYRRIMELQNKLPLAFECYRAAASFIPEHSFCRATPGDDERDDHFPWTCGAVNKPLFYYPEARPIDAPEDVSRVFLERNSTRWWLSEDALRAIRDYFILRDRRGRCSWAYRDASGSWFKHGEFV